MQNILIPILVVLVGWLIHIRYKEVCQKREKFNKEYSKFDGPLFRFVNALQDKKISLNACLITEFNGHKFAKEIFINNLRGRQLNKFNQKWAEYEEEYYQIKDLGVLGAAAAIAPSPEALASASHLDSEKWELERKRKICGIITELLKISKRKIWL